MSTSRARRGRLLLCLLTTFAVGITLLTSGAYVFYMSGSRCGNTVIVAHATMTAMTDAAVHYKRDVGEWPKSLESLHELSRAGMPYLDRKWPMTTPWNGVYFYDPSGSHHEGRKPDIWCEIPQGGTVCNWQMRILHKN